MRLFVGYGYNSRDHWIEEMVFPLVEALGCQVVHGKTTFGDVLAPEIKALLLGSDAMVGFLTRREKAGDCWSTHRWVIEELASAFGRMPVVEVRETGVDPQSGMLAGLQRISYCEEQRDRCLVDIAQAVGRMKNKIEQRVFRLEPTEFVSLFRSLLKKPGLRCSYRVMRRNTESDFCDAGISPVAGGLQLSVGGLGASDLIQVCVSYGDHSWTSDYEPVDSIRLRLSREQI
jgi:hypothetical protein